MNIFQGISGIFLLLCLVLTSASAQTFVPTGSLKTARDSHAATLLANGQVLVTGGCNGNVNNYFDSAELYDPASGLWSDAGHMSTERCFHTATLLPNGLVLVAGGRTNTSYTKSAELYDPSTGSWTPTGDMTTPRGYHTATLLTSGQVLVAGGFIDANGGTWLNSAELYNPATGQWTATGSLAQPHFNHSATLLANGQVLVAAGNTSDNTLSTTMELYDAASGQWTTTGNMLRPRSEQTTTMLQNGQVMVAGGLDLYSYSRDVELYNPATGLWKFTSGMLNYRYYPTSTLLPNGKVLVAGGPDASTELYDPSTALWGYAANMTDSRYAHTATRLPIGKILIAGGAGNSGVLASAELYSYLSVPVTLSDKTPNSNETLTATATPTGFDGPSNAISLNYAWAVNGTTQQSGPSNSFDLSQAGFGDGGQTVTCTVTATSGAQVATGTASAAVYNSILTVTNTSDAASDGTCSVAGTGDGCSLREAISAANTIPGDDVITFSAGLSGAIQLNSALPLLSSNISLQGPGARTLTVSGANFQGFYVSLGSIVQVSGLRVTNFLQGAFSNSGDLTVKACSVDSNRGQYGAAVFNNYTSTPAAKLTLTDSTFSGNSTSPGTGPDFGGAIFNGGQLTATNCTFSGNSSGIGGAISNNAGTTTLNNCTVSGNTTTSASSGAVSGTSLTLNNTIASGNTGNDVKSTATVGGDYILYGLAPSTTFSGTHNQIGVDPKLGPLTDNGGPTQTMALLAGSPAINKGNSTLTTDQRGSKRPIGPSPDLGAFEADSPQSGYFTTVTTTDDHDDGTCGLIDCTLREAINAVNASPSPYGISFSSTVFATPQTITLGGTQLPIITGTVSISGTTAGVTVNGNNTSRVFSVGSGGTLSLSRLTVTGGAALGADVAGSGGAISNSGTLRLSSCTLNGNTAHYGGALVNNGGGSAAKANATLTNCTFSGNSADKSGGAIFNYATSTGTATLSLDSCTLAANSAQLSAGGVYNYGFAGTGPSLSSKNTIWKTGAQGSNLLNDGGTVNSLGHNLSDDATGPNDGSTDQLSLDPKLGPLQNNGGPTATTALLFGSPAIDAGDTTLTVDERSVTRPKANSDDIGAYEFDNFSESLVVTTTADENNNTSDPRFGSGTSLREAIAYANAHAGADTITFAPSVTGTIALTSILPDLTTPISINGPGPKSLTVQRSTAAGTPAFRIFSAPYGWGVGPQISISGMTIANGSDPGLGGGICILNSRLTLSNCAFVGNSAEQGGGLALEGDFPQLNMSDCLFKGNSAVNGAGFFQEGSITTVTRCTFDHNNASGGGGGVFSSSVDGWTLSNSTFVGNTATGTGGFGGGAIYYSFGNFSLESCTLIGNSATDTGGGINNFAQYPGTVNIHNCLVAGNNATSGPDIGGPFNSQGYNLIGNTSGAQGTANTGDLTNVTVLKLGSLTENGGPTPTVPLLAGSPAINAGDPGTSALATDQRGLPRVVMGRQDIGAFEFADAASPVIVENTPFNNQNLVISAFKPGSVTGTASDDVGVVKVEMKLSRLRNGIVQIWNGSAWGSANARTTATLTGSGTNVNWSMTNQFPTSAQLDEGQYIILMSASDAVGNTASVTTRVNLYASDTTAPVTIIGTPTLNQKVLISGFGAGSISGIATDNLGVSSVRIKLSRKRGTNYYWNGTAFTTAAVLLNATVTPVGGSNVKWNLDSQMPPASALDSGLYQIDVYAMDAAGNKSVTVTRPFTLGTDFTAPSVSISAPTSGQKIDINAFGPGSINGTAGDNVGVTSVKIKLSRKRGTTTTYWDGTSFTTTSTTVDTTITSVGGVNVTWSLDSHVPTPATGLDAGSYTLYASSFDAAGNTKTSASRSFTITGTPSGAPSSAIESKSASGS